MSISAACNALNIQFSDRVNSYVGVHTFPSFRQEKGERMGHGIKGRWRGWQGLKFLLSCASVAARIEWRPVARLAVDSDKGDQPAFALQFQSQQLTLSKA
jgi:hypothetical protein